MYSRWLPSSSVVASLAQLVGQIRWASAPSSARYAEVLLQKHPPITTVGVFIGEGKVIVFTSHTVPLYIIQRIWKSSVKITSYRLSTFCKNISQSTRGRLLPRVQHDGMSMRIIVSILRTKWARWVAPQCQISYTRENNISDTLWAYDWSTTGVVSKTRYEASVRCIRVWTGVYHTKTVAFI